MPPGDVEAAEATCPVGMKIIVGGFSAIGDDAAMRVAIGDRAAICHRASGPNLEAKNADLRAEISRLHDGRAADPTDC